MNILLAIDGSQQSEAVIEWCARFGKIVTRIKLVTVIELNYAIASDPFAASAEIFIEIEANERKNAAQRIEKAQTRLRELFLDHNCEIITKTVNGIPAQVIVEEAENWEADLIMVGSHGYGFWQRTVIGSVSDAVIHHAKCSVLVVK